MTNEILLKLWEEKYPDIRKKLEEILPADKLTSPDAISAHRRSISNTNPNDYVEFEADSTMKARDIASRTTQKLKIHNAFWYAKQMEYNNKNGHIKVRVYFMRSTDAVAFKMAMD